MAAGWVVSAARHARGPTGTEHNPHWVLTDQATLVDSSTVDIINM